MSAGWITSGKKYKVSVSGFSLCLSVHIIMCSVHTIYTFDLTIKLSVIFICWILSSLASLSYKCDGCQTQKNYNIKCKKLQTVWGSPIFDLSVSLVVWESWILTGTIKRWQVSWCPAQSQLTGPTPIAPTCCWMWEIVTSMTAATSLAVGNHEAGSLNSLYKKMTFLISIVCLSCSTQFSHCHAISDNEPLHQRSAGIRILL